MSVRLALMFGVFWQKVSDQARRSKLSEANRQTETYRRVFPDCSLEEKHVRACMPTRPTLLVQVDNPGLSSHLCGECASEPGGLLSVVSASLCTHGPCGRWCGWWWVPGWVVGWVGVGTMMGVYPWVGWVLLPGYPGPLTPGRVNTEAGWPSVEDYWSLEGPGCLGQQLLSSRRGQPASVGIQASKASLPG